MKKTIPFLFFTVAALCSPAQNECTQWYFGGHAALNFMNNPPGVLNNSAMAANSGCSSVADVLGNVLFYTNGATVWNRQHAIMANGTASIAGSYAATYPMIVKQPGNSNLYYIFTAFPSPGATTFPIPAPVITTGLYYSVVDMSLAGGMGSVTVNNALIYTAPNYLGGTGQLHGTKHANGIDYWIMTHEYGNTNNFRAYLLTSAGISTAAVVSPVGQSYPGGSYGYIKFSPTGQKLCVSVSYVGVELYDFDNNTGLLSNPLTLLSDIMERNYRGCEFSADGTKLYAGHNIAGSTSNSKLIQWDLSAGPASAILSSSVNIPSGSLDPAALQLAPNGKIYVASTSASSSVSVINSPNTAGTGCNFVANGQVVSAAISPTLTSSALTSFPNMITRLANTPCATQTVSNPKSICAGDYYAIANHTYATTGSYIDTLQNVFGCNGIVILNTQLTVNNLPNLNVSASSTICINEAMTLTASGASSYSWSTGQTGASISVAPAVTTAYSVYGVNGYDCEASRQIVVSVSPCTGVEELNIENEALTIYPTPAAEVLKIESIATNSELEVSIIDGLGKVIRNEKLRVKNGRSEIDVSGLENGVYMICFSNEKEKSVMKKLVIAK